MRGLPPSVIRLPDLDREPWARLAALGRFLLECVTRSAGGYVCITCGCVRSSSHAAMIRGPDAHEWRVYTKNPDGRSDRNSGATLEEALERACARLVGRA